ncbi:MAG: zeta toxin family protein [Defluviitaleaceae bacterium]|nr:zeta toxin family protein [Defluviitaleaceae bacterium]
MRYTIIGGLNGVGKSTIYTTLTVEEASKLGKRINVDEIASSLGDWRDTKVQYTAGKQAVKLIRNCLESKCDFHQESTLSGHTILNTIKKAKDRGYSVHLWYIYVVNVELAKQRVLERIANGGHGIPEHIIERRSVTSLAMFRKILPLCNEVRVYDNTTTFNPVARVVNNQLKIFVKNIPLDVLSCLEKM